MGVYSSLEGGLSLSALLLGVGCGVGEVVVNSLQTSKKTDLHHIHSLGVTRRIQRICG